MQQTNQGVGAGNRPGDSGKDQRRPLETRMALGRLEEDNATRRSEQRKDAEKEWSWLRDLNGSSGLSEVESGGPSAQRCTGGFEPGLSLVLSPCRSPGDPASHCDWLATARWGAKGTRTAFEPQKGGQAEEEKRTQAFSL